MPYRFRKHELYCDGGVIGRNPSIHGGTWAYRLLDDGIVVAERSGRITRQQSLMETVSNNFTELLAIIHGIEDLPPDWDGMILSDSQISLGRVFNEWKLNGIPFWMISKLSYAKKAQNNVKTWTYTLLQGHPTKAELAKGIGSRGYPVSEHNVWCDQACGAQAQKWMADNL